MVCELFYHMRVILCLRVNNCLLITSADPITQGPKTSWIEYYVLFSHRPSGFFQIMCLQSLTFREVLSMYLWLGDTNWLSIAWLRVQRRVQQCATGYAICDSTSLSGIFSPSCVNESKMDAWEQNHHLYGSFQHAVFHLSIQRRMKSHEFLRATPVLLYVIRATYPSSQDFWIALSS